MSWLYSSELALATVTKHVDNELLDVRNSQHDCAQAKTKSSSKCAKSSKQVEIAEDLGGLVILTS
jgi:hypothetical protein